MRHRRYGPACIPLPLVRASARVQIPSVLSRGTSGYRTKTSALQDKTSAGFLGFLGPECPGGYL